MTSAYKITCRMCRKSHILYLEDEAVERWQNGELIQHCFPQLRPAERELMISQTCEKCFHRMFSEPWDNEDDDDLTIEWGANPPIGPGHSQNVVSKLAKCDQIFKIKYDILYL